MTAPNEVIASSCNLNFPNGSGRKAWPQDAGRSPEEVCLCGSEQCNHFVPRSEQSFLQSCTPRIVSPPSKSATEATQDSASDSSLETQAETPIHQPATEPGVPGVPDMLLPGPKQDYVGLSDPENKWITDEDISSANNLQETDISPLEASNKRFEARHRYLNVREQLPRVLRVGRVSVIGNSLYTSARWWRWRRGGGKVVAARWWRFAGRTRYVS
jgi:hypothetical protein